MPIMVETQTPEKAIEELNEIFKDVQEQIHDQWDWMDASFNVAVLAAHIEHRNELLGSAYHALRSYQYGNTSEELAEGIADKIEPYLAREVSK